jgi:hypothetical protein
MMSAPDASTPPSPTPSPSPGPAPHPTPSPSPGAAPTPPGAAPAPLSTETTPATETAQWVFPEPAPPAPLAGWALTFSVIALAASLFVGWAFPLGLGGVVIAIVAMRRPAESRGVAVWALCLGVVSVLYSAGWLLWAAGRASVVG